MTAIALTLRQQRCVHHPQREASARCPECGKYYCRECITEHDDRVLCASCLAKLTRAKEKKTRSWTLVPRVALALVAMAVIFVLILLAGNALLSIPSSFHNAGGW
jgi:uncharacterized paraquat-inducible protein A